MIPRKRSVFIGSSLPMKKEKSKNTSGKTVTSTNTNPIKSHKKEYSSFNFLRLTSSIIPISITRPINITMIFNLWEISPPLTYFFFRKSITNIDKNVLKI